MIDCDEFVRERVVAILTQDKPAIVDRDDQAENAKTFESGARAAQAEALLDGRGYIVVHDWERLEALVRAGGRH